jgi:hypothetical protein
VESSLVAISQTRGTRAKEELLKGLLIRASPAQARFIVKVITSDLRIGLVEGLLEEAVARLGCAPLSQGRRANMLLGDIGQTALLARQRHLDTARMCLFHPPGFMLASPLAEAQDGSVLGTVYGHNRSVKYSDPMGNYSYYADWAYYDPLPPEHRPPAPTMTPEAYQAWAVVEPLGGVARLTPVKPSSGQRPATPKANLDPLIGGPSGSSILQRCCRTLECA